MKWTILLLALAASTGDAGRIKGKSDNELIQQAIAPEQLTETIAYLPKEVNGAVVVVNRGTNIWEATTYNASREEWMQKPDYGKHGLAYRKTKQDDDRMNQGPDWGEMVIGVDEGDGWVRCLVPMEEMKKVECVWNKLTLCESVMVYRRFYEYSTLSYEQWVKQKQVCLKEFFADEDAAFASCPAEIYMATTGCGWTAEWNCPTQPAGSKSSAKDKTTLGYELCCTRDGWKPAELDKQAQLKIAAAKGSKHEEEKWKQAEAADAWSRVRKVVPEKPTETIAYLPMVVNGVSVLTNAGTNVWKANSWSSVGSIGVSYRKTKQDDDRMDMGPAWGAVVIGVDEGDGWLRCIVDEAKSQVGQQLTPAQ